MFLNTIQEQILFTSICYVNTKSKRFEGPYYYIHKSLYKESPNETM